MSNPIKEFFKDHNPSNIEAPEWVSNQVDAMESAYDKAGDGLANTYAKGKKMCRSVQKRVGQEASDADEFLHHNPYPTILIGMLVTGVIGYLVACRVNRCANMRRTCG